MFWHILWQLEKWTIKYLICSVCHWAIWWQGWRWRAALPAARCPRKPAPLLPPWLPPQDWRRCGINEQRKRLREEGVVSAQRMLWNSSTCGEKHFLFKDCVSGFRFYAAGFESAELQLPSWAALLNSQVFPFFYRICCSLTLINKLEVSGASAVAQDSGLHCGCGQHQGHSGAAASKTSHCFWRHVQVPLLHIRHSSGCLALKSTLTACITRKTQHKPHFLSLSPAFCEVFVSHSWTDILDKRWEKIHVILQLYQCSM